MEAFVDLELPVPSLEEQRRIADFLDAETARIDQLCDRYSELRRRFIERADADLDRRLCEFSASMPLKYMVAFREGPGIMAVDFQDAGIPLVRLPGLRKGEVTLHGCNYLSEPAVATRWHKFRLRLGDYIISGSATMGEVSIVRDEDVVGAVPYTGLIILRPATRGVNMSYVAAFLRSSLFSNQINLLKTGAAMQHFGPTHLSQISIPVPDDRQQSAIAEQYEKERERVVKLTGLIDRQLSLAAERRQALITAAVTGQFDETTGRGVDAS
jgi:type I restriction enzyme S subunit